MSIERIAKIISTGIVIPLVFVFVLIGWNGKYVKRDVYEHSIERQCWIEDEWIDVDSYLIQWGTDWYKIDRLKVYVQGRELQCSSERVKTYIETKEVYQPGLKNIIMFWEQGD